MTYALTGIIVVLVLLVAFIIRESRLERAQLEDRLMTICEPVAQIQYKAAEDSTPAQVTYVDEAEEYRLSVSSN